MKKQQEKVFMKKLKQLIAHIKTLNTNPSNELNDEILQLICYAPKMPLRLQQEQLLNETTRFSFKVKDEYFAKKELSFFGFKWGNGKHKVLITHGWGSKAADFAEIITALKKIDNLEIIAFDAPGNGSSEGELSNLLLFVKAVETIVSNFGIPDVMIGHSLGAMANVIALKRMRFVPSLLVSLAPLILLKENFEASMQTVGISKTSQDRFLKGFEDTFNIPASSFNLNDWYSFEYPPKHWLGYDQNDQTAPFKFLKTFLDKNTSIISHKFDGVGHDKILKSPDVIQGLTEIVNGTLSNKNDL